MVSAAVVLRLTVREQINNFGPPIDDLSFSPDKIGIITGTGEPGLLGSLAMLQPMLER
jgi:hypothetical protein